MTETRCFPVQWVPILYFCEIHMLLSCGNCSLSFLFNLTEPPSNLSIRTVFMPIFESPETWLHQPDTEPRRAGSRIVQMIC